MVSLPLASASAQKNRRLTVGGNLYNAARLPAPPFSIWGYWYDRSDSAWRGPGRSIPSTAFFPLAPKGYDIWEEAISTKLEVLLDGTLSKKKQQNDGQTV